MSDGRTHWDDCWREPGHHDCAIARLETALAENGRMKAELAARGPSQYLYIDFLCMKCHTTDRSKCDCASSRRSEK